MFGFAGSRYVAGFARTVFIFRFARTRVLGLALSLAVCGGCAAAEPTGRAEPTNTTTTTNTGTTTATTTDQGQHWLLVLQQTAAGWEIRERVLVEAALPRRRNSSRRMRPFVVEVRDAEGKTLYRDSLPDPSWVSGESVDPDSGETTHHRIKPPQGAAVTVRVPILPTARALTITLHGTQLVPADRGIALGAGGFGNTAR